MKIISEILNLKGRWPERAGFIFLFSGNYATISNLLKMVNRYQNAMEIMG
jgi:hypothetical protein